MGRDKYRFFAGNANQGLLGRHTTCAAALLALSPVSALATTASASAAQLGSVAWLLIVVVILLLAVTGYALLRMQRQGARERAFQEQLREQAGELIARAEQLQQLTQEKNRLSQRLQDQALAFEKMAYEDDLSGLPNRRAFEEALTRSMSLAQRGGQPLSLMLMDVSDVARLRAELSDSVGDLAICDVGELLRRSLRGSDMPARLDGEMFAVLLHDTARTEGELVQARLARLFAQFDGWGGREDGSIKVAFRAGLVQMEEGDLTAASLCHRAERALEQATSSELARA